MNLALKFEVASKIMPFTYLPVVLSFLLDIFVYQIPLSLLSLFGTLMIALSVLGPTILKAK